MLLSGTKTHFNIYYWSLIIFAASLSLSRFALTVAQIIMVLNWLSEGNFNTKFRILKSRKGIILVISIFLIHLIGLIYSEDLSQGLHDIKIKLPLLAFPLIVGTSPALNNKQLKKLLLIFAAAVSISTFISIGYFLGFPIHSIIKSVPEKFNDIREISIFIDHIRFSLLINIAIFSLLYYLIFAGDKHKTITILIYILIIGWLIVFLFILLSMTGLIVFLISAFILFIYWIKKQKRRILRISLFSILIIVPIIIISYLVSSVIKFYDVKKTDIQSLEKTTSQGNYYWHDLDNTQVENGSYVGLYICEKELIEEWEKISEFKYFSKDKKNQEIRYTLIRFLTSRGFRKDAEGVRKLTKDDISLIEEGYANYIFKNKLSLKAKIYQIIWQLDVYNKGGNPSGHSVTQRIEYIKVASRIIKQNFWTGVGTGDLINSYRIEYEKMDSTLDMNRRLRAHNQYLTFLAAFGIFGFLWIMYALIYPVVLERKSMNYFFVIYFIIAFLSMLNEDTIETQAGASFFAFFYSLFLFGYKKEDTEQYQGHR
ncbi:O-antigen ligase family protein [Bacteroidota bacterium]